MSFEYDRVRYGPSQKPQKRRNILSTAFALPIRCGLLLFGALILIFRISLFSTIGAFEIGCEGEKYLACDQTICKITFTFCGLSFKFIPIIACSSTE
jgi:hypothetical protein